MRLICLRGQRFGRLRVSAYIGGTRRTSWWACHCDCGRETACESYRLRRGLVRSCGCSLRGPRQSRRLEHRLGAMIAEIARAA